MDHYISDWLAAQGYGVGQFPVNVTLRFFVQLTRNPGVYAGFLAAQTNPRLLPAHRVWALHRMIGRIVKNQLGASYFGRRIGRNRGLNRTSVLIESCAWLVP